jgi:uncharacterized FlgJ-related protein
MNLEIYKNNPKTLKSENITLTVILSFFGFALVGALIGGLFMTKRVDNIKYITEETKQIIIREQLVENKFTPERLKEYILELNIRFPHIVYAQAQLESGNFTSHIFNVNNNLFGMKEAKRRPTTNKGTENGHAYFNHWKESVVDYAFYQAAYLNDIRSEKEYWEYLGQNYAEDPNYISKLKKIIEKTTE